MRTTVAIRSLLFSVVLLALSHGAFGQMAVGISVHFGPPALPVYEQPICPGEGYMWVPGYWAYDDADGYYWVPGTWVEAPEPGFLWTPGYWGWNNGVYLWNAGYWGPHIGFYGGINYGFGYFGTGFYGGEWRGRTFFYNTAIVHVNTTVIRNVYVNNTVIVHNDSHVAFNGGQGGVESRPTAQEEQYSHERHIPPVAAQNQHFQEARNNPELRASANHGKPPIAATARPADFKTGFVPSREAGGEYKPAPANGAGENRGQPENGARPGAENNATHASELQPHSAPAPNTGNSAADRKYQQQQDKLAAKQQQEHQKLAQQQEKEHQQAAAKNYNDAQKQQMEQRHAQQTQQMEQRHATQQRQMQQRQPAPKAEKPR